MNSHRKSNLNKTFTSLCLRTTTKVSQMLCPLHWPKVFQMMFQNLKCQHYEREMLF